MAIIFFALADAAIAADMPPISADGTEKLSSDSAVYVSMAIHSLKLQTEMPEDTEEVSPEDYHKFKFPQWAVKIAGFLRQYAKLILFASVGIIAAVVLINLKNNLWSFSRSQKLSFGGDKMADPSGAVARMEQAQAEAEDLAGEGSFAQAMHMLLLRSVNEMRGRLSSPIAASLTSREILSHLGLSAEEREAFAAIVGCVEISYFGAHTPGEDEYTACRGNFDALASLLRQGHI
jgi:hypothetical protein